jgi:pyruvate kinase
VEVVVKRVDDGKMYCQVIYGEYIKPGKAMNLPGCEYTKDVLTEKDKVNLTHAMKTGWDIVAASYVRNAKSAKVVREFISSSGMKLIAKIEDGEGIKNLEEILPEVHGIMIARGGLGLELGLEKILLVQKDLIKRLNHAGLPVITATQMLESMNKNPKPTRAEATDVANAILLGTDAVMLSGESAMGKYPVESVKMMQQIAAEVEKEIKPELLDDGAFAPLTTKAIAKAAAEVCISMGEDLDSVIIVSKSGTTARLVARHGIKQPIFVFTSTDNNKRALMLSKCIDCTFKFEGIKGRVSNYNRDTAIRIILKQALKEGVIKKGQKILFLGKTPVDKEEFFPNLFEIIKI